MEFNTHKRKILINNTPLSPLKHKLKPNSIILPSNTFNFTKLHSSTYNEPTPNKTHCFPKVRLLKSTTSIKDKMNDLFINLNYDSKSKTYMYYNSMKKFANTHNKLKTHFETRNNLTIEPNKFFHQDEKNLTMKHLLSGNKTERNNKKDDGYGMKEISTGFDSEDVININNNNKENDESVVSIEKDIEILNCKDKEKNENEGSWEEEGDDGWKGV